MTPQIRLRRAAERFFEGVPPEQTATLTELRPAMLDRAIH